MGVVVSASAMKHMETFVYIYTIIIIIQIHAQFVSSSHANVLGTINFNEKLWIMATYFTSSANENRSLTSTADPTTHCTGHITEPHILRQ